MARAEACAKPHVLFAGPRPKPSPPSRSSLVEPATRGRATPYAVKLALCVAEPPPARPSRPCAPSPRAPFASPDPRSRRSHTMPCIASRRAYAVTATPDHLTSCLFALRTTSSGLRRRSYTPSTPCACVCAACLVVARVARCKVVVLCSLHAHARSPALSHIVVAVVLACCCMRFYLRMSLVRITPLVVRL